MVCSIHCQIMVKVNSLTLFTFKQRTMALNIDLKFIDSKMPNVSMEEIVDLLSVYNTK